MWICQPKSVRLRIDPNRHVVAVFQKYGEQPQWDIDRQVKSCIGLTQKQAIERLQHNLNVYLKQVCNANLNRFEVSDFDVYFDIQETEDSSFWSGASMIRSCAVKDLVKYYG